MQLLSFANSALAPGLLVIIPALLAGAGDQDPPVPQAPGDSLEIITWNTLVGFREKSQLAGATAWLASRKPDIVALQELNGFTEATLREAATGWGHEHAVMAKERGYPVGLTSRSPIEVIERRLEGMHHGYLHARTAGLDVLVVHLNPGDWTFRRREVAILAPLVERLIAEEREVVVLGDFNAHHPLDCAHLAGQAPLIERRTAGKNLIDHRVFDYGVLARFAEAGLHDPVHRILGDDAAEIGTFPTRVLGHAATEETQRGFLERIDFVLLAPRTLRRCTAVSLPRDPVLDSVLDVASDHYPVTVTLAARRAR